MTDTPPPDQTDQADPEHGVPTAPTPMRPVAVRKRSAARLVAIQFTYSLEVTESKITSEDIDSALPSFLASYEAKILRRLKVKKLDHAHLSALVAGVVAEKTDLDHLIAERLGVNWHITRLGRHEICVLRAGVYELKMMPQIPAKAILSEYITLADAFHADVGFIHAILDKIAHTYRPAS